MNTSNEIVILKRVLHKKGGLEKNTLRLALAFVEKNYKVTIITTTPACHLPKELIIHTVSFPQKFAFQQILQFDRYCQKWIQQYKPKYVLGMDRNSFQTHLRAGNGSHLHYLQSRKHTDSFLKRLSFYFNPLHKNILKLEKQAFENPKLQKLITNSYMVKQQILHNFSIAEERIEVIHNGVEWKEMQKDFDAWPKGKAQMLQQYHLDPDAIFLLFVGNGYKRKGLKPLLQALSLIKDKHFYLFVIGKEKKISFYKNLCKRLHIQDKVLFLQEQDNLIPFYQISDILLLPTFYDPFANVILEALAMGLFVVTSKYNGAQEVLTKNNGLLFTNIINPQEMAITIQQALLYKKNDRTSSKIRNSIAHLDFTKQLTKYIQCICQE